MNYRVGTEVDTQLIDYTGLDVMVDAGIGMYRHMDINWADWEPNAPVGGVHTYVAPAAYSWRAALDDGIARASAAGMQVCICVRNAPAWAKTYGNAAVDVLDPSHYTDFRDFLNTIITRYKAAPYNVLYYELWNEPDSLDTTRPDQVGCWLTAKSYIEMLQVVYPYVKDTSRHPEVYIINGGVADIGTWTQEFITGRRNNVVVCNPGINYVDIFAYHAYEQIYRGAGSWRLWPDSNPTKPHFVYRLDLIKALIDGANVSASKKLIPIWMNEGGALGMGVSGTGGTDYDLIFRVAQSGFITYMLAYMVGEERLALYSWWPWLTACGPYWSSSGVGIIAGDPWHYEPYTLPYWGGIAEAFKFGIEFTAGCTHISTTKVGDVTTIKLLGANGKERWLMWNSGAPIKCSWPSGADAIYSSCGEQINPPGAIFDGVYLDTVSWGGNGMALWLEWL